MEMEKVGLPLAGPGRLAAATHTWKQRGQPQKMSLGGEGPPGEQRPGGADNGGSCFFTVWAACFWQVSRQATTLGLVRRNHEENQLLVKCPTYFNGSSGGWSYSFAPLNNC
jgi:hypothetical protein